LFINQTNAGSLQTLQRLFDVVDSHSNMMNTFPTLIHKFFDGGFGPRWLEKFDAAFANIQHRNTDSLIIDFIVARELQAHSLFIYLQGRSNRFYGNTDMIDLHHGLPNFASRTILSTMEYGSCLRSAISPAIRSRSPFEKTC